MSDTNQARKKDVRQLAELLGGMKYTTALRVVESLRVGEVPGGYELADLMPALTHRGGPIFERPVEFPPAAISNLDRLVEVAAQVDAMTHPHNCFGVDYLVFSAGATAVSELGYVELVIDTVKDFLGDSAEGDPWDPGRLYYDVDEMRDELMRDSISELQWAARRAGYELD